ncbi:MAG: pyruvate, water dikinase regulatory protein [Pseudomonadota bacterium]
MPDSASHHIHLISDSTGETLHAMARACLAPFDGPPPALHAWIFVRTARDLDRALAGLERRPGLVCFTLVEHGLRTRLEETCARLGVPALAVLDPLTAQLSGFLGRLPRRGVGFQHQLDQAYFQRIAALDFALANDDGMLGSRLSRADVILTGVSRTSKTPTCIYLAHRGIKAANMPLVPGQTPDPAFFTALEAGIPAIGLTLSPTRLAQIRSQRLEALGDRPQEYADIERIRTEVADARLFFERHALPVIDVTRRSIEETAAAIQAILSPEITAP